MSYFVILKMITVNYINNNCVYLILLNNKYFECFTMILKMVTVNYLKNICVYLCYKINKYSEFKKNAHIFIISKIDLRYFKADNFYIINI